MINYFIFGLGYAFACAVQPGPFQAFLFSQSIANGWRKTIPLVFAPLLSDIPVILLVLLVLNNVPEAMVWMLQCVGGVFMLYLAYKAYITWKVYDIGKKQDVEPQHNVFKAVLVNVFNPNPYLGWSLVMGPQLIKGWSEAKVNGIALLVGFYSSLILYSIGIVVIFAAARNFGPRVIRISIGISVIAFVVFGCYQLWSGIHQFL